MAMLQFVPHQGERNYMLRKIRAPKLTPTEMTEEVSRRTFIKREDVVKVFDAYAEMVEECVLAGVAVPLPHLGTLDYKDKVSPAGAKYFNVLTKQVEETTKTREYRYMTFRINGLIRNRLREATIKEMTGDDNGQTE